MKTSDKKPFMGYPWGFILILCFLAGLFIGHDWSGLILKVIPGFYFYLKGLFSLICGILVWTIGQKSVDKTDLQILMVSFLMIFLGDMLFIIPEVTPWNPTNLFVITMVFFMVFQILTIFRYSRNLTSIDLKSKNLIIVILAGVIFWGSIILYFSLGHQIVSKNGLLGPVIIYALMVTFSSWLGVWTLTMKNVPLINARLIAVGMTLFFMCDMAEASKILTIGSEWHVFFKKVTWLFYGPALVFLSLSGRNWTLNKK